jgi:hypothetical protein
MAKSTGKVVRYYVRVYFHGHLSAKHGPLLLEEARTLRNRLRSTLAPGSAFKVHCERDRRDYWAAREKRRRGPERRAQVRKAQREARARARGESHGS